MRYITNTAGNTFLTDKALIISWPYQCNCTDIDPFKKRTIPRKAPSHLPPLSKGGGLTARHKPWFYCFLLAICPPFLCCKLFCRQDGGIASRCTEYCCLHNHCKRTTHPRSALNLPRQRWTSVARSSRANYSGDCSCLEVVSLIALFLVLSLVNIDRCIDLNSEPEKCCPTKRTIGSLLLHR